MLGLARNWTMLAFIAVALAGGCATPCVDDGLGQKHCPADDDGGNEAGETGTTGDSGDDHGETGTGGGGTCDLFRLDLTPQTPTIVLLVDQSSSMTAAFDTTNRWDAIQATLLDPQDGVVTNLQAEVRFGLSLYTSTDGDMGGACPLLTETAPALDNLANIEMVFQQNGPVDETPTGESLAVVADALSMDASPGEKYVVLATDGEPDTCAEPNPQNGQALAVMAAQDAYAKGVKTFIISVGEEVSNDHLQEMANAGAGVQMGDPDATFYKALDQQALLDAFNEIIQGTRDCRIDLDMAIIPEKANLCTVAVNGMDLDLDDPHGWEVNTSTEIELVGDACGDIQEGEVTIEMSCDCAALQ
jgi:hypothetical protein